jgi:hypothetical protein
MENLGGNVPPSCVGAEPEACIREGPLERAPGKSEGILREQNRRAERHADCQKEQEKPDESGGAPNEAL